METTKIRLTKEVIEQAPLPAAGYSLLRDAGQSGLAVRVMASGTKSYVFDGRLGGVMKRITVGDCASMTVAAARRKVCDLKGDNEAPEPERTTLGGLFTEYMQRHAINKKSGEQDREIYESLVPKAWRPLKLTDITPAMVSKWHHQIGTQRGPYRANRALALLRCMFNLAKGDWELFSGENPCRVKAYKEPSRERYLSPEEVGRLSAALTEEPSVYWRTFFPLSLLTGCRRGELLAARWRDVDLDRAVLSLPNTKSGRTVTIPLVPAAVDLLRSLPSYGTSEWVFPASRSRSGHAEVPKKAWANLLKRAGLADADVRIHDLRRTVGSWLAGAGNSLPLIGKALGHTSLQATQVYARLDLDPVRKALEAHALVLAAAAANGVAVEEDADAAPAKAD